MTDHTAGRRARRRGIAFDLMDTILVDPYFEAIERVTGLTLEQIGPLRAPEAHRRFEMGRIDEAEYGRSYFRPEAGRHLDVARLRREMESGYRFVDGMRELLDRWAPRVEIHVWTNYSPWYESLRRRFELDRWVRGHHPSYEVGARKPERAFFTRALARAGLAPGEVVFVDDRVENVEGARRAGIAAVHFTGAGALERRLVEIFGGD